jgi:hypothetical protein
LLGGRALRHSPHQTVEAVLTVTLEPALAMNPSSRGGAVVGITSLMA